MRRALSIVIVAAAVGGGAVPAWGQTDPPPTDPPPSTDPPPPSSTDPPTSTTNPPVNVAPTAVATIGVAGLTVTFDGSASTDGDGTITSFSWDFGDGTSGSGATASHTYSVDGSYAATLTVTDDDGATGTASVAVDAAEAPLPPSNILAIAWGSYAAAVAWGRSPSSDVVAYRIIVDGSLYTTVPAGTASTMSAGVLGLAPASYHTVQVVAVDAGGRTSPPVSATLATPAPPGPPAPPPPTGLGLAGPGARGTTVRAIQKRLLDLHFWLSGVDGVYGLTTQQAVMAFQKYHGMARTGRVDAATLAMLKVSAMPVASPYWWNGIEIDKGRQIQLYVKNASVRWVFNTSTGSNKPYVEINRKTKKKITGDARTPTGYFRIYYERPNGWWEGTLGRLYRPKYVVGGVAIHGAGNVPGYPASHGCARVTPAAMDFIWKANLAPVGTRVYIHE